MRRPATALARLDAGRSVAASGRSRVLRDIRRVNHGELLGRHGGEILLAQSARLTQNRFLDQVAHQPRIPKRLIPPLACSLDDRADRLGCLGREGIACSAAIEMKICASSLGV